MTPIDYVRHGWAICPIPHGLKNPTAPGWQERDRVCTTPERAATFHENVGLCHAYSGTCAIDIDDSALAVLWFNEHGIDIQALWNAPDAVKIVGRPGRAKLLFKLATPLPTKQIQAPDGHMILELRCGTHRGTTAQDVLPPSIHPDTGQPYTWQFGVVGDWRELPEIPVALEILWKQLVARPERAAIPAPQGANADRIRKILTEHDADMSYPEWVKVGQILHHETSGSDEGLALWDEWSLKGSKYNGYDELEYKWGTFGYHPNPATLASLQVHRAATPDDFDVVVQSTATPAALAIANVDRFQPVPWYEFIKGKRLSWRVKRVMPDAGLGVVYGDSGSGKTFWALDLVTSVARGVPWRGRKVKQGRVTYICAEGVEGFRNRVDAYAQQHQIAHTWDALPINVIGAAPNLTDGEAAIDVTQRIVNTGGADVIVIDTLAATTPGANENGSEDMGKFLYHCKEMQRVTGAVVLVIHHSGKDAAKGARGWSGVRAAIDFEVEITRVGDSRIARLSKEKDDGDGQSFAFKLTVVTLGIDEDNEPITSCIVNDAELPTKTKTGKVLKGVPLTVLEVARDLSGLTGGKGSVEALVTAAEPKLTKPELGSRDRRREDIRRAINNSLAGVHLSIDGDSFSLL